MAVHFLTFIALFLCLYLAVLYQNLAACAVFLFLGIYLILAFCQLFYLSRNLQFEIVRTSASKSPMAESVSTICNLQEKPCQTQKLTFSVRGKGETQLCGTLEIKRRKRLSFGSGPGYAGKLSHADGNGF